MASEYRIDVKNAGGSRVAEISNMLSLAYTRKVNAPGIATFTLPPEHPAIADLELDGQIEAWWRDRSAGIPWRCDFATLYRSGEYIVDTNGDEVFGATCVGHLHFLSRRVVAYPAGIALFSVMKDLPAETVMRRIVSANCTVNASLANGRLRVGAIAGISVETDQARGNVVSWSGPGKMVLTELQDLAAPTVGGGDFDLVRTGDATWVWRFYPGQIGTDRSSGPGAVTFARDFDNMGEPHYTYNRIEEKTVAIVGGQGEERARLTTVRTGPDYSAANDIEMFVDARNTPSLAGLQTSGDRALSEARARPTLTFTPLQTPQTRYGLHYFLGDLVRARYRGLTVVLKVVSATRSIVKSGDEQVAVELAAL